MSVSNYLDDLNGYPDPCMPPVGPGQCMPPMPPAAPANNSGFGCGLGSWIWILLILFYSSGFAGTGNSCCKPQQYKCCKCGDKCCCKPDSGSSCSSYLFLLVILFLCGGNLGGNCDGFFNGCGC